MSKKKKSQCPLCNSNYAIGNDYEHVREALGIKKQDNLRVGKQDKKEVF